MKKRILFVDSDSATLKDLSSALADMDQEWDMSFVATGNEALAAVGESGCDLLLASDTLDGSPGIDLLDEVGKRHPNTVRFLRCNAAENDLIMRCVWGT